MKSNQFINFTTEEENEITDNIASVRRILDAHKDSAEAELTDEALAVISFLRKFRNYIKLNIGKTQGTVNRFLPVVIPANFRTNDPLAVYSQAVNIMGLLDMLYFNLPENLQVTLAADYEDVYNTFRVLRRHSHFVNKNLK